MTIERSFSPAVVGLTIGPPNKGLSTDLDALAACTTSHSFTLSPL